RISLRPQVPGPKPPIHVYSRCTRRPGAERGTRRDQLCAHGCVRRNVLLRNLHAYAPRGNIHLRKLLAPWVARTPILITGKPGGTPWTRTFHRSSPTGTPVREFFLSAGNRVIMELEEAARRSPKCYTGIARCF